MTTPRTRRRAPAQPAPLRIEDLETEAGFQQWVITRAEHYGFVAWHDRDSRKNERGLPDLILVYCGTQDGRVPGRLIFAELKRQRGKLSLDQKVWQLMLSTVPSIESYVWRPADRPLIERILAGEVAA